MKRNILISLSVLIMFGVLFITSGCTTTAEQQTQQIVNEQQNKYSISQPVPVFDWSLDRDTMIQIYKAKNQPLNTWTVFLSLSGKALFICPSIGYPIPGGTSLTNPQQIQYTSSSSGVISQAEPNGLFPPSAAAGTYVRCVRSNGDTVPVYSEPDVMTFPYPVTIDATGNIVEVPNSVSSVKVTTGQSK